VEELPHPRVNLGFAAATVGLAVVGSKVLFAGGLMSGETSDIVDIYDVSDGSWTSAQLSSARTDFHVVVVGSKALFMGGKTEPGGEGPWVRGTVDIYDAATGGWSASERPAGRRLDSQSVVVGTKAFITSPYDDLVEIFDAATSQWSVHRLTGIRGGPDPVVVGGKILFAGGRASQNPEFMLTGTASNIVDIFDTRTGTWSAARLSQPRYQMTTAVVGDRALFVGGTAGDGRDSGLVDIYDAE
jgi:hypothetical protein